MFDRLLAVLLKLIITALIAAGVAVAVVSAYSGITYLARVRLREAGWMLGLAIVSGYIAYAIGSRRADLADS